MAEWRVFVRNPSLVEQGELEWFAGATFTKRLNGEGSWDIQGLRSDDPLAGVLDWDSSSGDQGIILTRDDVAIMSGPVTRIAPVEDDQAVHDDATGELVPTVEASGMDDTAMLADRSILPNYDGPPYTAAFDTVGPIDAEAALRHFVTRHAADQATAARKVPGLVLGTYSGFGITVTKSYPWTNLLVALADIALTVDREAAPDYDGLQFEVVQQADGSRTFVTRLPSDLRQRIRLSVQAGTLGSIATSEEAAGGNYVYILGGDVTNRVVVEGGDPESIARYGRREVVVAQEHTTDDVELAGALAKALEDGREDLTLAVDPLDDEGAEYGVDYQLGDRVTAVLADGREIEGYVVEVTIQLDASGGAIVTPVIATTRVPPSNRDYLARLGQRLGHLERTTDSKISIGMSMLWWRPVAEIPAGWELLDGGGSIPIDTRNRFLLGATGDYAIGQLGGLSMAGGNVTVNLQHSHTVPDHSHGPGSLAFPHTHSHSHGPNTLAFPHTHPGSHSHGPGTLDIVHTHTSQAHTHPGSHSHGMNNHNHLTDIDHSHPSVTIANSSGATTVQSGTGVSVASTTHGHPGSTANALGSTPVASGNQSSGGNSTQSDSTAPAASYSGSPSTDTISSRSGTTDADSNAPAASPGTSSGVTSTDATAAAPGTATGATASVTGVSTGNNLSTGQSVLNPLIGAAVIYRTV